MLTSFVLHPGTRDLLQLMHYFCGRYTFVPMDGYFVTFGTPGTDTYIRHIRAIQRKGLGMYDRFLTNLEYSQFEGAIYRQALRICLIESHSPMPKCAKIQEATRHTLTCLWCAHRVAKHHCNIARQPIVHQPFFTW